MVTVKIVSASKHSMNGEPVVKESPPWLSSGLPPPLSLGETAVAERTEIETAPSYHHLIPYTLLMLLLAVLTRLMWLIL
jgi:hypothetical protein